MLDDKIMTIEDALETHKLENEFSFAGRRRIEDEKNIGFIRWFQNYCIDNIER